MDFHNNLHSFCDWALQSCSLYWDTNVDALVWQEKLFFPPFSIELKFNHQLRPTTIPAIIPILFVNRYYSHVLLIRIYDIDALV